MAQAWHNLDLGRESLVVEGDCHPAVQAMTAAGVQFDSIVVDPPYGVGPWDWGVLPQAVWETLLQSIKPGGFMLVTGNPRTFHRQTCLIEDAGWLIRDTLIWLSDQGFTNKIGEASWAVHKELMGGRAEIQRGMFTPDSTKWRGWGSKLKPSWEPITLCQKPGEKRMALDLLKEGVGALNLSPPGVPGQMRLYHQDDWPPKNVIVDEGTIDDLATILGPQMYRLFFCRNITSTERHAGMDLEADKLGNDHPTVRPIKLMRWLISLITPPGGLVLDPCCGSGTSGCAAALEDVRYVGVDLDPRYVEISKRRIAYWQEQHELEQAKELKKVARYRVQPRVKILVGRSVKKGGVCRNGHELTPGNVYERPDGRRECLTCKRLARHGVKSKDQ